MKPSVVGLLAGLLGIAYGSATTTHSSDSITSFPGHRVTRPIPTHTSSVEEPSASSSGCFYFCPRCPRGVCLYRCMTICPDFSSTHVSTPTASSMPSHPSTTFSSTPVSKKPKTI
ncbi:hypothetical protein GGF39_000265, partial [Coemansia sp. RSA 1721]